MKNKKKNALILVLAGVILIALAVFLIFTLLSKNMTHDSSKTTIITYSNENSTIIVTKNNVDKTASINIKFYESSTDSAFDEMGIDLGTRLMCGVLSMAFFNETSTQQMQSEFDDWNKMSITSKDDKGNSLKPPQGNPLEGYKVSEIAFSLIDKNKNTVLGECTITGYGADFIKMKINGKDVSFEAQ